MTIYQVTPTSNKQAGTWTSQTVLVTGDEGDTATLWLRDGNSQQLWSEPSTTEMFWVIEHSVDGNDPWQSATFTTVKGNDGVEFPKPILLSVTIGGLVGKYVRTRTVTNDAFRFGIDLEII